MHDSITYWICVPVVPTRLCVAMLLRVVSLANDVAPLRRSTSHHDDMQYASLEDIVAVRSTGTHPNNDNTGKEGRAHCTVQTQPHKFLAHSPGSRRNLEGCLAAQSWTRCLVAVMCDLGVSVGRSARLHSCGLYIVQVLLALGALAYFLVSGFLYVSSLCILASARWGSRGGKCTLSNLLLPSRHPIPTKQHPHLHLGVISRRVFVGRVPLAHRLCGSTDFVCDVGGV